jgi:uncharacterized membrane protein YheB (UPF0754 family)
MNYWLSLIPFISAFIGWFTNWIAIKMLFHPRLPIKILGITFHGIFPKRQQQFAEKLGKMVSTELISFQEIEEKITQSRNLEKVLPFIEERIDDFLPIISMFIGDSTISQLKTVFMEELKVIFPEMIRKYIKNLESEMNLEQMVTAKVAKFSSEKMESILIQIMSKEFRFVEIIGGVLGFLIGILQIIITIVTS